MLKNLMEDKRLDFNAPLLSVRRFHSSISSKATASAAAANNSKKPMAEENPPPPPPTSAAAASRSSLPYYKSDLKSGPVRNPGVVPFGWEQSPGRPKDGSSSGEQVARTVDRPPVAPKLPPGRISHWRDEREENSFPDSGIANPSGGCQGEEKSSERLKADENVAVKEESAEHPISANDCRGGGEDGVGSAGDGTAGGGGGDDDDEDAFSDALDTMSRAESCFMNCSISGMTGIAGTAGPDTGRSGSCFSTDPQVRDFMMGRFLPAAQAMATGSPHTTSRKPSASAARGPARRIENGEGRRPLPMPYQIRPNIIPRYPGYHPVGVVVSDEDDEDEDDYDEDAHQLSLKGCGLLPRFCLKSSICLMNPVPGVRARGRVRIPARGRLSPAIKPSSNQESVVGAEDETWEAVYRHKLGRGHPMHMEDGSKLTSESYQLTYWSDSQSHDGSSPYRRSTGGGISPYRNDAPQSPFHEGKGFLGVPLPDGKVDKSDSFESGSKGSDKYLEIRPHPSSKSGSGHESPAVEKSLYVDSVSVPETPNSKWSSTDTKVLVYLADKDPETVAQSGRMEEKVVPCEGNNLPADVPEIVEIGRQVPAYKSNSVEKMAGSKEVRETVGIDASEPNKLYDQAKNDGNALQSLLPPPLPKSPSESWLWRTLPSVSSKNPTSQSFLGIQFHSKKTPAQTISNDLKCETVVKTSKAHSGQMRFSEVLSKPINGDS